MRVFWTKFFRWVGARISGSHPYNFRVGARISGSHPYNSRVKSYLTSWSYFELVQVESGFQVGLEFDKKKIYIKYFSPMSCQKSLWSVVGMARWILVFKVKILLLFRGKEATLVLVSPGKNLRPKFRSWGKNCGPMKKVFRLWPTFWEQLFKMS